jgi:hypothetical protein
MRIRDMKITIPNRDIDDPDETTDIEPVELDLGSGDEAPQSSDFAALAARAGADWDAGQLREQERSKMRDAQAEFEAGVKGLANGIKARTGFSVGYQKPWVFKPGPKAAYGLWKRVISLFLLKSEMLDLGPTALVELLAPIEPNYEVTRDMLYRPLSKYAVFDLKRLLVDHAINLKLKSPTSIRSVQRQLKERRDALAQADAVEKFAGRFEIRGDTAYVNGKPYKVQRGASGKPRIKRDGEWLSLDALRAFCRKAG